MAGHPTVVTGGAGETSAAPAVEAAGAPAAVEAAPATAEQEKKTSVTGAAGAGVNAGYAGSGAGRRIFAPQTMSQTAAPGRDKSLGGGQPKLRLARAPIWALVAGGSVVVILIVGTLLLLMNAPWHGATTKPAGGGLQPTSLTGSGAGANRSGPGVLEVVGGNTGGATAGRVWEAGTVNRVHELYYVVIASTPAESIAQRNAKFLADHGVDVSIERQEDKKTKLVLYTIVSVKGFASQTEAVPYVRQIVLIGHELPEFKKTHQAWDGAFPARVTPLKK